MPDQRTRITLSGVDISHSRLIELMKLADQAKPFYDWVEAAFREVLRRKLPLGNILETATPEEIARCLASCFRARDRNLPILFDGVGRAYSHRLACYYFFAWLARDAPVQRLGPLITRIRKASGQGMDEVRIAALTALIVGYRDELGAFSWPALREVIADRLEGSRRSIKGHEREIVVRIALATAIQNYYSERGNYGIYASAHIPKKQIKIGVETYDVSVELRDESGKRIRRLLVPVKTRETEGGGHSSLYARDIAPAFSAARVHSPGDFVIAVIVARNWSETEAVISQVDHAAIFDLSPNDFEMFDEAKQQELNTFVANVLDGTVSAKRPDNVTPGQAP